MSRQTWSTIDRFPPGPVAGSGRTDSLPETTQYTNPPGERRTSKEWSRAWRSTWMPLSLESSRCTRRNASPYGGTSVANSPCSPRTSDDPKPVTCCQNATPVSNSSARRSRNAVSQVGCTRTNLVDGRRAFPRLDDAAPVRQYRELHAVAQVELRQEARDVGLHRRLAQEQP